MKNLLIAIMAMALLVPVLSGCRTSPVTGRKQLILVGQEQELQLGEQAFQEVIKTSKVVTDPELNAILQRIGKRIADAADQPDYKWEFKLIESPEANAFCLPGGKVAVYTGLLPVAQTEGALATVIGHEVAHALAKHGVERMSHSMVVQLIGQGVALGTQKMSPAMQQGVLTAFGAGTTVGVILPFSRTQEADADEIGLMLTADAGYDPRAAIPFWERMSEGKKESLGWLRTHPLTSDRIEHLEELLPSAIKRYQQQPDKVGEGVTLPLENLPQLAKEAE